MPSGVPYQELPTGGVTPLTCAPLCHLPWRGSRGRWTQTPLGGHDGQFQWRGAISVLNFSLVFNWRGCAFFSFSFLIDGNWLLDFLTNSFSCLACRSPFAHLNILKIPIFSGIGFFLVVRQGRRPLASLLHLRLFGNHPSPFLLEFFFFLGNETKRKQCQSATPLRAVPALS